MQEHDKNMILTWKEDLANLLIFVCISMVCPYIEIAADITLCSSTGWPILQRCDWLCRDVIDRAATSRP